MPGFVYKAIGPDGKEKKGSIQAASSEQAIMRIKGDGLIPVEVAPENVLNKDISISIGGGKITSRDYCVFCRQMLAILSAGVSIINALQMLSEQTENVPLKKGIAKLADEVGKGETLSNAMRKQPKIFPSIFVNLVEAGEATGTLEVSFERMALQFEKDNQLQQVVKKAITYPIIVGVVAVGVIFAMMTFVIPTFMGMFADMDVEMPAITQFVISMSDFFVAYWWMILIIVVAAVFLIILSLIILIDLISIYIKKEKGFWIKFLYIFGFIILIGLGITILLLNFSSNEENQSLIKMILIILIGILLIIVGSFLIFYYAMNPKFKVTSKEFVTDDGKKVTISTSETTVKIKRKKYNRKEKEISNNEESTSLTVADDTNKQS